MTARALGHYEIVESLGSGGMGVVYRARDTRLGREVAIKVLRQDATWTTAARDRLLREARAISKLSHPNICTVHDIGELDGDTFIVMELVPGVQLTHRLTAQVSIRKRPRAGEPNLPMPSTMRICTASSIATSNLPMSSSLPQAP